jgi:hypothetical protein
LLVSTFCFSTFGVGAEIARRFTRSSGGFRFGIEAGQLRLDRYTVDVKSGAKDGRRVCRLTDAISTGRALHFVHAAR